MKLFVKKLSPAATLPSYSYDDDAAFDLFASADTTIASGERAQVQTGIAIEIPRGYVGLIWDKSGISHKLGLKVLGGVIDSGYRGEVIVCLANLAVAAYTFKQGEKVAQMLIQKKEMPEIVEVEELGDTERGARGFGSSGK